MACATLVERNRAASAECDDDGRYAEPPPERFAHHHRRRYVGDRHAAQAFRLGAVDQQHVHGRPESVRDRRGIGGRGRR